MPKFVNKHPWLSLFGATTAGLVLYMEFGIAREKRRQAEFEARQLFILEQRRLEREKHAT